MAARVRLTVIGFGTLFLLVLTLWLLAGAPGAQQRSNMDVTNGFAGAIRPEIPVRELTGVHDENGKPLSLAKGDVTIVTFLYTTCEDACPPSASRCVRARPPRRRSGRDRALRRPARRLRAACTQVPGRPGTPRASALRPRAARRAPAPVGLLRHRAADEGVRPHGAGDPARPRRPAAHRVPGRQAHPEGIAHDVEALRAEG